MNSIQKYFTAKNIYLFTIHLAVVLLAFEVIVISNQNKKLKEEQRMGGERGVAIKVGDTLTFGKLQSLGSSTSVDTLSPTLVFVFTTTCPFCKKNISQWKDIYRQVKSRINIIAISVDAEDKSRALITTDTINYPVSVSLDAKKFRETNHISGVPATLLLDNGIVRNVWGGLLTDEQKAEIVATIPPTH